MKAKQFKNIIVEAALGTKAVRKALDLNKVDTEKRVVAAVVEALEDYTILVNGAKPKSGGCCGGCSSQYSDQPRKFPQPVEGEIVDDGYELPEGFTYIALPRFDETSPNRELMVRGPNKLIIGSVFELITPGFCVPVCGYCPAFKNTDGSALYSPVYESLSDALEDFIKFYKWHVSTGGNDVTDEDSEAFEKLLVEAPATVGANKEDVSLATNPMMRQFLAEYDWESGLLKLDYGFYGSLSDDGNVLTIAKLVNGKLDEKNAFKFIYHTNRVDGSPLAKGSKKRFEVVYPDGTSSNRLTFGDALNEFYFQVTHVFK